MRTPLGTPPEIPGYECVHRIGEGSYGVVWMAKDVSGAFRAIKFIHRDRFEDAKPFEREFSAIKKYEGLSRRHPALIDILHVGRHHDDFFYYVMYLADPLNAKAAAPDVSYRPKTLSAVINRKRMIPFATVIKDVTHLLSGLNVLHRAGLIHRDIKPGNVLYLDGQPVLADIGLIAYQGDEVSVVGTPGYMPPEGPGKLAADLYAMGMLLYVMASGNQPSSFPDAPTLPNEDCRKAFARLNPIILKACNTNSRKRYTSAYTMSRALMAVKPESGCQGGQKRRTGGDPKELSGSSKMVFKKEAIRLICVGSANAFKRSPKNQHVLTQADLWHILAKTCLLFDKRFGSVPPEIRVACKLAEAILEPRPFKRLGLVRAAVGLGGGRAGVGMVIERVGTVLGWKHRLLEAFMGCFMDATSFETSKWLSNGGPTVAKYLLWRRSDPVAETDQALKALKFGVLAATDVIWARHEETSDT